jgi:curved DNA-binding protein CbpA
VGTQGRIKQSLYDVLGVPPDANDEEIRRAYKTLARKFHPDLNQDNPQAEMMFKAVGRANEVLSDPDKREAYDQSLRRDTATPPGGVARQNAPRKLDLVLVVFALFLILSVIFFFFDTPKGLYFLVVAVALEIRTSIESLRADLRLKRQ